MYPFAPIKPSRTEIDKTLNPVDVHGAVQEESDKAGPGHVLAGPAVRGYFFFTG